MYDVVINACLIQGEIIVASLLFIMLIKDWQLRQALKKNAQTALPRNLLNPSPPPRFTRLGRLTGRYSSASTTS
jgi:hypothetical protein